MPPKKKPAAGGLEDDGSGEGEDRSSESGSGSNPTDPASEGNPEDEILGGRVPLNLEQLAISGFRREVKLLETRLGQIEAKATAAAEKGNSS